MKTSRIVIADPSVVVQKGLSAMLRELPEYEVLLASGDWSAVLTRCSVSTPEVLIINPDMVDYSKRMMVRSLFTDCPNLRIVAFVSSYVDERLLKQFDAVIGITDDLQRIRYALNSLATVDRADDEAVDPLSDREKEVLICLSKGQKNNEIADALNISVHTVITHRKNIVKKTGIKSVAALTVYAILNNLIDEKDII